MHFFGLEFEVMQRNLVASNENKNFVEEVFIIVRSLKNKTGKQKAILVLILKIISY